MDQIFLGFLILFGWFASFAKAAHMQCSNNMNHGSHSCIFSGTGSMKCWGRNDFGQLGYGDTNNRGDGGGEMGNNLDVVNLGTVVFVSGGEVHTCVILDDGITKCFGYNFYGNLGYGDIDSRGDGGNEMGSYLDVQNLGTGRTASQISSGKYFNCVLLDDESGVCWGNNNFGQLGRGQLGLGPFGDEANEMGDNLIAVNWFDYCRV